MQQNPSIDYAAITDVGLKRAHNEDAISVVPELGLTILADGMGRYNAGEIASMMCINVISNFIHDKLHRLRAYLLPYQVDDLKNMMVDAVELANIAILQAAADDPQYFGMGTTLVSTLSAKDNLIVAHVGDSRAYRLRNGELTQITHDHSVVQEQIDAGLITEGSAHTSDIKNLVTRAVGVMDLMEVEVHAHKTEPQDLYLLCSDGLSDMLLPHEIAEILVKPELSLTDMSRELVDLANLHGGRDNISVILFKT